MTECPAQEAAFRLGKSTLRLQFDRESHGLSSSWRMSVVHTAPRTRKNRVELPLLDVSPRKPLLTLQVGSESFPLMIDAWEARRGGKFRLEGARKLGLDKKRRASWSAEMIARTIEGRVYLDFEFIVKFEPRTLTGVALRISLPVPICDPLIAVSEVATVRGDSAAIAWGFDMPFAVSFVAPTGSESDGEPWDERGAFVARLPAASLGARRRIAASIAFAPVATGRDVKDALLAHYAAMRQPALPEAQSWDMSLTETALQAVAAVCDKGAYERRGVERAYFLPPFTQGPARLAVPKFYSGYPYFPVDAAKSILDWYRITDDEPSARIAALCARGIAADFGVTAGPGVHEGNKGAFWDLYKMPAGPRSGQFSGFDENSSYSILSNARVARAMFDVYSHTKEQIFASAALGACQWLILRQNAAGYYDGDRFRAAGEFGGAVNHLAGVEAIPPLVAAFNVTKNEVFIKAAWRIANYVIEEILPHHPAPTVLPVERSSPIDSPIGLASVIRAFLYLDAESPNKRLREALGQVGARFRCFPFERLEDPDFNYDNQWSGLYECAAAAFWLFNLQRDTSMLEIGMRLIQAVPPQSRLSWRAINVFATALSSLVALKKGASVDLINLSVTTNWRTYKPDTATGKYIKLEYDTESGARVDHLSLVSRGDDQALTIILADHDVPDLRLIKNGRRPLLRDQVNGAIVGDYVPLHSVPISGPWHYGIVTIDV